MLKRNIKHIFLVRVDSIIQCLRQLASGKNDPMCTFRSIDVLECEFYVVECLQFDLVLFHVYRPLTLILAELSMEEECMKIAWDICNDSYRSDAIMMYPPYLVALAAVYIALVKVQRDPEEYFVRFNVNRDQLKTVINILLDIYTSHTPTMKDDLEALITKLNQNVPAVVVNYI